MGSSNVARRTARPLSTKQPPIILQSAPADLPPREVIEQRLGALGDRLARVQGIIGTVLAAANHLEDRSHGGDEATDLRCALEAAYDLLDTLDYDYIARLLGPHDLGR